MFDKQHAKQHSLSAVCENETKHSNKHVIHMKMSKTIVDLLIFIETIL